MKLEKKIVNKRGIIIVSILLGILFVLTGCGKAEISVKTYDKENEVETSKIAEVNTVSNTTEENKVEENKTTNTGKNNGTSEIEEVKKVIKNTDWRSVSGKSQQYEASYIDVTYAKIFVEDKATYLVDVINTVDNAHTVYVLTYQNGKVKICNNPITTEYADALLDRTHGVIVTVNDAEGTVDDLYTIEDGEFVKFGYSTYDGEEHFYIYDKPVSQSYFFSYVDMNNAKSITTKNVEDIF